MPQQARHFMRSLRAGLLPLALTLSLGLVGIPSPSHAAQPPAPRLIAKTEPEQAPAEQQPPRAALRVDTEALDASDDALKAKIVEVATGVFSKQGFSDALDDQDPTIVVVVERTGSEENPGFVVGYSIEKGDEVVPGSARQSDCSLCTRTELVERIEKELPGLLKLALDHQAVRTVEDVGGGDGDGDGDGDVGEVDQRKIGPLGFAGIGLGVVGAAGVGVGVGLAVKGFEPIAPSQRQLKDYRTPGNVILSVGGAALIAGIVMIAVDVSKRKKARSRKQANVEPFGFGIAF